MKIAESLKQDGTTSLCSEILFLDNTVQVLPTYASKSGCDDLNVALAASAPSCSALYHRNGHGIIEVNQLLECNGDFQTTGAEG